MVTAESPRPLNEIIESLKEDLVAQAPDHKGEIESMVNEAFRKDKICLQDGEEIGGIGTVFNNFEKSFPEYLPQEIRDQVRAIRIMVDEQIRLGNIVLTESETP